MPRQVVDQRVRDRIRTLSVVYGLGTKVIAERLGFAERTIRVYLRAIRTGEAPYAPAGAPSLGAKSAPKDSDGACTGVADYVSS